VFELQFTRVWVRLTNSEAPRSLFISVRMDPNLPLTQIASFKFYGLLLSPPPWYAGVVKASNGVSLSRMLLQ